MQLFCHYLSSSWSEREKWLPRDIHYIESSVGGIGKNIKLLISNCKIVIF